MGAGIAITREDLSSTELRAAAGRTRDAHASRRLLALALVLDGADRRSAARTAGMDRQTLRDWVHRYNAHGIEGLANRKPPGPDERLSAEQQQHLAELVETGPDREADGVVRWRRVDLQKKIEQLWGVKLHERSVGKILKKLGYRRLSTRPQHPRADEQAQEAFKKTSPKLSVAPCRDQPSASRSKSGSRTKLASASKVR